MTRGRSVVAMGRAIGAMFAVTAAWAQQSGPASSTAPASQPSIEDEVLANLRSLPVGGHTLADWNYPEEFLRRVADRILRASYERNFRRVVQDDSPDSQPTSASAPASRPTSQPTATVTEMEIVAGEFAALQALREARPALRSFRAPIRGENSIFPFEPAAPESDAGDAAAIPLVARQLAREGLLMTTARALDLLGPTFLSAIAAANAESDRLAVRRRLASIGIPVDWLAAFGNAADGNDRDFAVIRKIAGELTSGRRGAELAGFLAQRPFRPVQALPGFALETECGESGVGEINLQLSRATDWLAPGDGGAVDIFRQLVTLVPNSTFRVLATSTDARLITQTAASWPSASGTRVRVHQSPLPVSQWAQDNHKFGRSAGAVRRIVPRYPTRGEDGGTFIPGEAIWGCIDPDAVQSPLLFQGGNLLCVRDTVRNERVLLLGEAEVHRNAALGLSRAQVLEAFRVEMGVDRCIILPAASFHIDFELCVRIVDGKTVAFVNDAEAARRVILACGVEALERGGMIDSANAQAARKALDEKKGKEFIGAVGDALQAQSVDFGTFPKRVTNWFSRGPADSGVGNFLLFLHAVDSHLTASLSENEVPSDRPGGYARAIRSDAAQRAALQRQLADLGWRIVPVPGLSNGERGVTYINGIHTRNEYWMPVWGGLYSPLDDAARAAFRAALGDKVKLIAIHTSETQRRGGGLHCAVSVAPRSE